MTAPRMTTTDAPVTVEPQDREAGLALRLHTTSVRPGDRRYNEICADYRSGKKDASESVQAFTRHRLAALASAPAGDGVEEATDDGPCTDCYDTGVTIQTERPCSCDAAALARPRAAVGERYTGQGFLMPATGLDEDGMCNEHGRQGCRACVGDLLAPLAQEAAAMPYRDGVIRIIAEAGKLNEGAHADWTVHAEAFADMILALQSPPAKVER